MISTIELYCAIRERLEKTFPQILVQQKDIKNIIRPSFYVQFVGKNFEKTAQEYYEDKISFNVVYFAEKEALLELLEIEEALTIAFNAPLSIADDTNIIDIEKDAIQSNLNEDDYYLSMTIDFVLLQRSFNSESGYNMEYVEIEGVRYLLKNEIQSLTKSEMQLYKKQQYCDVQSDAIVEEIEI